MALTYERVRADVAELLYLEPDEVSATDDLLAAGLDSVRLFDLVERWRGHGATIDFVTLAERPTLAAWWSMLRG